MNLFMRINILSILSTSPPSYLIYLQEAPLFTGSSLVNFTKQNKEFRPFLTFLS